MRKPFVAGNWKMNKTITEGTSLARAVATGLEDDMVDVAVIPPFLAIPAVAQVASETPVRVGAQDVYFEESGAFTGEISCSMLKDAGCSFALVGHSERRHVLGETDELIRRKIEGLVTAKLGVVFCIGELLEEREAGRTEAVIESQMRAALKDLSKEDTTDLTVAYEPVWAIGTGKTATTEQAEQAHRFVRALLLELFDKDTAQRIRIQYGGSVKPDNAAALMAQPNVDGALVGGASLDPKSFLGIIEGSK